MGIFFMAGWNTETQDGLLEEILEILYCGMHQHYARPPDHIFHDASFFEVYYYGKHALEMHFLCKHS